MPNPELEPIELSDEERQTLERRSRRPKSAQSRPGRVNSDLVGLARTSLAAATLAR
jgi:hypothetical protein